MSFFKKFLTKFGSAASEPVDEKNLLTLIPALFESPPSEEAPFSRKAEKVSERRRREVLNEFRAGRAVYMMDARGKTGGVLIIKGDKPEGTEEPETALEIPPIESSVPSSLSRLIFLERPDGADEYHLNFHFLLPTRFGEDNRKGILREAEGAVLIRITGGKEEILLLVETEIWDHLEKNYPRDTLLTRAVDYFVLGNPPAEEDEAEETLSLGISRPEEFMAGRFFLPRQIARRPELILTRFETLRASRKGDLFTGTEGLWFRVRMEINGQVFPFYYYFDKLKRADALGRKEVFRQMFRLILKKNLKHFKECSIIVDKVGGDFDQPPTEPYLTDSVMMGFTLFSKSSRIHGWVIISTELVSLILHAILPPWAFRFLSDNLLNRLRMLLSLSRELQASGKMNLYERPEIEIPRGGDIYTRLRELKIGFIKLNELLELITPREARLIISNLLYRRGWTGANLRELFYFSFPAGYDDTGLEIWSTQTLIGFDEERFRTFLMKNMRDEWESSEHTGGDYDRGMLKHFEILRLIHEETASQELFTPTESLTSVLQGEFGRYREEIRLMLEEVLADKGYLRYSEAHIPELNRLLTTMKFENLVTLFRYCPEDFAHFRGVVSENLYRQTVEALGEADIELDEKSVESAVYYRRKIYEVLTLEREQEVHDV